MGVSPGPMQSHDLVSARGSVSAEDSWQGVLGLPVRLPFGLGCPCLCLIYTKSSLAWSQTSFDYYLPCKCSLVDLCWYDCEPSRPALVPAGFCWGMFAEYTTLTNILHRTQNHIQYGVSYTSLGDPGDGYINSPQDRLLTPKCHGTRSISATFVFFRMRPHWRLVSR